VTVELNSSMHPELKVLGGEICMTGSNIGLLEGCNFVGIRLNMSKEWIDWMQCRKQETGNRKQETGNRK